MMKQVVKIAIILLISTLSVSKQLISVPPIDTNEFRSGTILTYQQSRTKIVRSVEINSFSKAFQVAFANDSPMVALAVSSFKSDNDINKGVNFQLEIRIIDAGGFQFTIRNWNYIHRLDVSFIAFDPSFPGGLTLIPELKAVQVVSTQIPRALYNENRYYEYPPNSYKRIKMQTFFNGLRLQTYNGSNSSTQQVLTIAQQVYDQDIRTDQFRNNTHFRLKITSPFRTTLIQLSILFYKEIITGFNDEPFPLNFASYGPSKTYSAAIQVLLQTNPATLGSYKQQQLGQHFLFGFNSIYLAVPVDQQNTINGGHCNLNFQSFSNPSTVVVQVNQMLQSISDRKCSLGLKLQIFSITSSKCPLQAVAYNKQQNICVNQCNQGFTLDFQELGRYTWQCRTCYQRCLTCQYNQPQICLSCSGQHNRIKQGFYCDCKAGFFNQDNKAACKKCSESIPYCDSCQSNTSCLACQNFFIYSSSNRSCYANCTLIPQATVLSSDRVTCLCQSGFKWSQQLGRCAKDCSSVLNSPGASSLTQCRCIQNYSWDSQSQTCLVNCSSISNSISTATIQNQCQCQAGFRWNVIQKLCLKDCSSVLNSLQVSVSDKQCACRPYTYWKSDDQSCNINCNQIYNSGGVKVSPTQCNCLSGYTWNHINFQCHKDCSEVQKSNGQADSQTSCICQNGYLWNSDHDACFRDCRTVQNSNGYSVSLLQCQCKQGYIWSHQADYCVDDCPLQYKWRQQTQICWRDCDSIENSQGILENYKDECNCTFRYFWNSTKQKCQIDCRLIFKAYTISDSDTVCGCQQGFIWYPQFLQCRVNCTVPRATGKSIGINVCQCQTGLFWIPDLGKCFRNCLQFQKFPVSETQCACSQYQIWDKELDRCIVKCEYIPNAIEAVYDSNNNVNGCECEPKYYFAIHIAQCILNCSKIERTLYTVNNQCNCLQDYFWNSQNKECWRDCRIQDYSTGKALSQNICQCSQGYYWDQINQRCIKDCRNVQNSPNRSLSASSCECNHGLQWNNQRSICQKACSSMDYSGRAAHQDYLITQCSCLQGFKWDQSTELCKIDCDSVDYASGNSENRVNKCECQDKFYWEAFTLKCYRNCSLSENTQGYLIQGSYNQCKCPESFKWDDQNGNCVKQQPALIPGVVLAIALAVILLITITVVTISVRKGASISQSSLGRTSTKRTKASSISQK